MRSNDLPQRGFTLLEILVAMAILAIIILMLSQVFHQSRVAWDTGTRKTELNMEGRAVISLMAQELAQAVADGSRGYYTNDIQNNDDKIVFWTFGTATNGQRVARWINYSYSSTDKQVTRRCDMLDMTTGPYPKRIVVGGLPPPLADNVENLVFRTSDGQPHSTNLPAWVDIELSLGKKSGYSLIQISSDGPDGVQSTSDDIKSGDSRL